MADDSMKCPACQVPMTPGVAEIRGNSLGFLLVGFSWQELYFKAGDEEEDVSLLAPNEPRRAFRCPGCGLAIISQERMPSEASARADSTEPSECLACRAPLAPGETVCPRCGWTYKSLSG
jgi:predicted RNA-binding Zn-ribbon protein involved in translation (DUF1610 family)